WLAVEERKFDGSDRNEKVQEPAVGSRQLEHVKDRFGTEETEDDAVLSREGSVTIEHKDGVCLLCYSSATGLVWVSTSDGHRRWTSVPDRSVEEERRRLVVMC
ncbi:hypothetical protein B296_00045816, partial [Ensete ventricosum]